MALNIEGRNPSDGVSSFDQTEFHRSDTLTGVYTLQSTKSIDTSTVSDLSPGYTLFTDLTGDTTKFYKIRWKNSISAATSPYSDAFQGGTTVLDARFRKMMRDTNSNNYFFDNDDVAEFRQDAIFSLWPATWQEGIDTSLTTDETKDIYNLPGGVTRINKIDLLDSEGKLSSRSSSYEIQSNKIIFPVALKTGYTMRLWVEKMFLKSCEVPELFDSYLLDSMMLRAYRELEADRVKAYKYVTVAKPDNGSVTNIRDIIMRLETSTKKRLNELRRVRKPSDIGLQ
jgi:hypothetical protein